MKALWLARNRRGQRGAPRLSLFPFLAVLICTMGALVLLLLSVTRQARLQAAREAAAKDAEKQTSIASEMEMVQWRVEQLKNSRKATETQLAEARLVLGHVEDHGRRLRDQFQELTRQAKRAADEGLKPGRFVPAGEEELRQVEGQIAEAQQRLNRAQQASANRPKSYAIIPYDGPNSTRRRPIYIECRGDAVVLQPENIVFSEADFDEPLGPGNPLAAAVRAARQQMLLQGNVDPQNSGEPYPLLLVRPSGILAYECALAAMKSWGSEFGYELINADWQLKYPPPDPNLARAVTQALDLARMEHARLIAAAPSKYGKRPRLGAYRTSTGDESGGGYAQRAAGQGGAGAPVSIRRSPRSAMPMTPAEDRRRPAAAGVDLAVAAKTGAAAQAAVQPVAAEVVADMVPAATVPAATPIWPPTILMHRLPPLEQAVYRHCSLAERETDRGMVREMELGAQGDPARQAGLAFPRPCFPVEQETVRGMVREMELGARGDPARQPGWAFPRLCFPVEQETVRGMVQEMERVALRDPAPQVGWAFPRSCFPAETAMGRETPSPAALPAQRTRTLAVRTTTLLPATHRRRP